MRRKSVEEINKEIAAGLDPWEGASIEELSKYYDHYELMDIRKLRGEDRLVPDIGKRVRLFIGEFLLGLVCFTFIPCIILRLLWPDMNGWALSFLSICLAAIPSLTICIWEWKTKWTPRR